MTISAAERDAGCLGTASLAFATEGLRKSGVVVMKNALDPEPLRRLAQRMNDGLGDFLASSERRHGSPPHNFVWGNVQQDPPVQLAEHANAELLANPWALQVVAEATRHQSDTAAKAPGVQIWYSGNTSLSGSRTQPVHRDAEHGSPPLSQFVINVALCDVDEHNGSLEVWPGTHTGTDGQVIDQAERAAQEHWSGNVPRATWAAPSNPAAGARQLPARISGSAVHEAVAQRHAQPLERTAVHASCDRLRE